MFLPTLTAYLFISPQGAFDVLAQNPMEARSTAEALVGRTARICYAGENHQRAYAINQGLALADAVAAAVYGPQGE